MKNQDIENHLIKAKKHLSELIAKNMGLSGSSNKDYTILCEAQAELNMAIRKIKKNDKKNN